MTLLTLTRRAALTLCAGLFATMTALPAPAQAGQITVFAAASLKTALDQIAADWTTDTGNTAVVSYAGSSQLARQIQQGAPADLFLSADEAWMDTLDKAGLIQTATREDLLGNALVLVAPKAAAAPLAIAKGFDLAGMLGDNHVAMALVDSVPAGKYGKAALTSLGVWDAVAPKVAQSDNVRAALALVATGEAPFGIVYATDAAAEPRVAVVGTFPEDSHPPIIYPAALTKTAQGPAADFQHYLSGAKAVAVFAQQGFTVLKK
ncbi:MAG: molybdate ABC transporter substrate-binding protein [Rhodobacteraceae bacterium]|nr:molybdate ABC transporter substrate-binding protein [Paracoccaceae bacterium]